MWLITVIGTVHGQQEYTFVLEHGRTYTLGREATSDIVLNDNHMRMKEGVLEVGHWDPSNHATPPSLVYKSAPKKNGTFHDAIVASLLNDNAESTSKDDYAFATHASEGVVELESAKGVQINKYSWFTAYWKPLYYAFETRFTDDDLAMIDSLKRYCVSYTSTEFPRDNLPNVVITPSYRGSISCYHAIVFGIPMASLEWLTMLNARLRRCWKKVADSEDSFSVPDVDDPGYRPTFDPTAFKGVQTKPEFWYPPRPENHAMFADYSVVVLRTKKSFVKEMNLFRAMGASCSEINLFNPLLESVADLMARMVPFERAAAESNRLLIVVYYPSSKPELVERGVDFDAVVTVPLKAKGIPIVQGSVMWGSVYEGSVDAYFRNVYALQPSAPEPTPAEPTPAEPAAAEPPRRLTRRATSRQASAAPSRAPSPTPPDVVPSTYVDDSAPKTATPAQTEAPAPTPAASTRKPLKRRAGRDAPKLDLDDDLMGAPSTQIASLQPSRVPETQLPSSLPSASVVPDSMDVDTPPTSLQPSAPPPRPSRLLKRRAGATQSTFLDGVDTTINYQEKLEREEKDTQNRQLYEELRRGTTSTQSVVQNPPVQKRRRLEPVEESAPAEAIEVDEDDFVTKALRSARVKREKVSPVKKRTVPAPVEEEEQEEVEEQIEEPVKPKRGRQVAATKSTSGSKSPVKKPVTGAKAREVDKDERFLQVIAKARGKKGIDELDKEFNELRILKPAKGNRRWEAPDYTILDDFDEMTRGNFITIVKTDLFRKDPPKVAAVADDGRPNYKKFKKKDVVRRAPMHLVLAAPTAQAEMGEPYWAHEATQKHKTQGSQGSMLPPTIDDEFDAPTVPKKPQRQRRLLSQIAEHDDDDDGEDIILPSAARRLNRTQVTQSEVPPRSVRSSRAGSAMSDASSTTASAAAPPPSTRPQRAKRTTKQIVVDDDSDDEVLFTGTSSSRSTRPRGSAAAGPSAKSSTLADEPPATRASTRSTQRTTQAPTRRKLLVNNDDDDDDDALFLGVQKRRKVG